MDKMPWISFMVPLKWEEEAKRIREKRDALYGNIYQEEDTDERWVGDLGEICFYYWLKESGITDFEWHINNAAGKPDFTIHHNKVDIKTVKRRVPPQPHYTAQITARHKDHPIDELFFATYELEIKRLWFLGGISMQEFIKCARYYKEGEKVHEHYTIRPGHEIYNAAISLFTPPLTWLEKLKHPL
jgi:hypothetical protein